MPRSRGTEMPQRQSPRGAQPLRASSSLSDPLHHRPTTDKSPKVGDRRSPRSGSLQSSTEMVNPKKLGTRIADLESQLGQAQDELKNLKDQLVSAEAAKKEAQQQLDEKAKKPTETEDVKTANKTKAVDEVSYDNQCETDVFEVPVEKRTVEPNVQPGSSLINETEKETKPHKISTEIPAPMIPETEGPSFGELAPLKDDEINALKAKLEEKERELKMFGTEKENLKNELSEANSKIMSAKEKEEQLSSRLTRVEAELEASKASEAKLSENMKAVERVKEELEAERRTMRVQTEQWKKAADAAAAVLAGAAEFNGRVPVRCGSMDKQVMRGGDMFETPVDGYASYMGTRGMASDHEDDDFGGGKRKGSAVIRMFGDLWKKKGQK